MKDGLTELALRTWSRRCNNMYSANYYGRSVAFSAYWSNHLIQQSIFDPLIDSTHDIQNL
jgi:hypothetical protein